MTALAAHLVGLPARATRQPVPVLRRARAEDASAVSAFLQGLSAGSRRLRFHGNRNPQSQALALQLCQVDGVRHQAWFAWVGSGDGAVVVGEARFVVGADDDTGPDAAELAIAVADAWQGCGVADALMRQVVTAAAGAGVRHLYGDVLDGNSRMAAFMRRHGFEADLPACGDVLRMCRKPGAPPVGAGGVMARAMAALLALPLSPRRASRTRGLRVEA
jgi:acetyltransferase